MITDKCISSVVEVVASTAAASILSLTAQRDVWKVASVLRFECIFFGFKASRSSFRTPTSPDKFGRITLLIH